MRSVQKQVVSLLFGVLLVGFYATDTLAQSQISNRIEISTIKTDTTIFLGDWIIESSISVSPNDSISWSFDTSSGLIQIKASPITNIVVEYSSLPVSLPKNISLHRRIEFVEADSIGPVSQTSNPNNQRSSFDSDLTQSGSLSRGIIVGSNQDFALESGLNFELQGQLTDDITLDAVLTDQSIPIQPDGTTQSIREFDKVLIRLQSEKTRLEMGDVDVSLQQSTFAKLNRRLQGASGRYDSENGSINAAISSVRGTFLTQQFQGADGVQGPYRLRGTNGEEFIIVLAATERVYLNGIEVQRGEENQYIIDYGLGEITFTDNVFIKDETRIFVEYEYIDQDFNRTLIAAEAQESFFDDRFKLGFSVIRQADGDDLLSQQTLTEHDIRILEQAGDDLNQAIVSGVITNPDDEDINIRYAQIDTTFNGQIFSIFKNIPNSSASNLVVRFSNVGQGKGSYERVGDTINGLLYNWVGPGNGSYEPFRQLAAPQKHQILAMNTEFAISDKINWQSEFSFSDFDLNRFSSIDNGDNSDVAMQSNLSVKNLNIGFADLDITYHRRQSGNNFRFFERTREVEFDRKWNVGLLDLYGETLDELQANIYYSEHSTFNAGIGQLSFSGFESFRQNIQVNIAESERFRIDYSQEYISSKNSLINNSGSWFRQIGRINSKLTETLSPFLIFEQEDLRDRNNASGLIPTSLKFYEIGPGLGYSNDRLLISMAYVFRQEERVRNGEFEKEAVAREQRYEMDYNSEVGFRTNNKVHFRTKDFTEAFEAAGDTDQNGFQINSISSLNKENLSTRLIYRVNTQRQAIRQEAYIEVGPELGQYVWIDENENGVEEIDEFFPELSPNEGTYVLQFLPSDVLLPVINLNSRFTLDWQPFERISKGNESLKWLNSVRFTSLLDLLENSTTSRESDVYLLRFDTFRNDSTSISGTFRFEQGLNLDPVEDLSLKLSYSTSDVINKRTVEIQRRKSSQFFVDANYQLNRNVRLRIDGVYGVNKLISNALASRTYDIKFISFNPGFSSRLSRSFQFGLNAGYSFKEDLQLESVTANTFKLSTFSRAFLWQKVQTSANIELRDTRIGGITNSFTNFELTEGTGSGTNLVWSISSNYRLNNLVRLNLNYDGRTVSDRPNIHTIKLVVSAVF
jgi:hypothetical protein